MARCVLAFLAGRRRRSRRAAPSCCAAVDADTAAWRRDTPTLQYALPIAQGTRVSVALDLPGIDRILAAEFADLAQTGGFGFGSGWVSLLQAQAAWLRGRTGEALRRHASRPARRSPRPGSTTATRTPPAPPWRPLRGESELATASMAAAEAAAGTCDGLFYPWQEQARAWTAGVPAATWPGAVRQLQAPLPRLRADGLPATSCSPSTTWSGSAGPTWPPTGWRAAGRRARRTRRAAADAARPGGRGRRLRRRAVRGGPGVRASWLPGLRRGGRGRRGPAVPGRPRPAGAGGEHPAGRRAGPLRPAAARPRCWPCSRPLTIRERQVAELAAEGARSREIADRLYLSPRTVENHLQRVYAKLGSTAGIALAPGAAHRCRNRVGA